MIRKRATTALVAVACLALAGCGSSTVTTNTGPPAPAAPGGGPLDLRGACPDKVVLQQDWQPEVEYGSMYSLVGAAERTIDTELDRVSGPLVAQGVDTGVDVEVRPATIGGQPATALMATDPTITLAALASDDALSSLTTHPVVTVAAPITVSPQIIMWDPASHPGARTIAEAAAGGAPVVTSPTIAALLTRQGIIRPEQRDTSYEGTPARFVANPQILQQGFANAEPYLYQYETPQWGRPVTYQRLADVGFSVYPQSLVASADRLEELRPCLSKLVPILQQAQLDYLADPGPTNALMVELVDRYQNGWTYSPGVAAYASGELVRGGYVSNDPASGVFGTMDPARWQEIVATFGPILQADGSLPAGALPDPARLFTNEFLDPTIRMARS